MLIRKMKTDFFPKACADRKRDNHLRLERGRFGLNVKKEFYYEGGETLGWVAQRDCRLVSGIRSIGRCPYPWHRGWK